MSDHAFTIQLTRAELGQLEQLAAFQERDPAELLQALAMGGLHEARERHRAAELMNSGRHKPKKP